MGWFVFVQTNFTKTDCVWVSNRKSRDYQASMLAISLNASKQLKIPTHALLTRIIPHSKAFQTELRKPHGSFYLDSNIRISILILAAQKMYFTKTLLNKYYSRPAKGQLEPSGLRPDTISLSRHISGFKHPLKSSNQELPSILNFIVLIFVKFQNKIECS